MTRSRKTQLRTTAKCRDITSYFSHTAMRTAIFPPPAKRVKVNPLPLPATTATVPPSLPSPSPSPLSLSSRFPMPASSTTANHSLSPPSKLTGFISTSPSPTTQLPPSSPPLPPTPTSPLPPTPTSPLPLSLLDDLENILILRNIDTRRKNDCVGEVRPFTRGQACLVHSFLDQIDHMGTSRERLNRLLDYLELSVSPGRMPSGDIISQLWSVTTDISVIEDRTLSSEMVLKASSLFDTLLTLHPPTRSPLALAQYRHFIQTLGGSRQGSIFPAWLHIKELLSAPCFYHHLTFLVDLLLIDFWSHVTSSQTGSPLFVSIFWDSPSGTDTMSLPVRQLLESIHHTLDHYTGTEIEFMVLQSQVVLLHLVMTHCTDMQVTVNLERMTLGLTDAQFILFLSLLYSLSLQRLLTAYRLQHSPTTRAVGTQTQHSSSKLPDINKLRITNSLPSTLHRTTAEVHNNCVPQSTALSKAVPRTNGTTTSSSSSHTAQDINRKPGPSAEVSGQAMLAPAALPSAAPPLKTQNVPTSTKLLPVKRFYSHHTHSSMAKKVKLSGKSCENCDFGALVCLRCKPSQI